MSTEMPIEVQNAFKRYENLKAEGKLIEGQLKELQPLLLPYIPEGGDIETADGKFTVRAKTTYTYSPDTQALEADLKERKKREEQDGTAKAKKGEPYVQYNPKKGEED